MVYPSESQTDPYYVAIGPDGAVLHANVFGSLGIDSGRGAAVAPGGRFALTGTFKGNINFGGNQLSSSVDYDDLFVATFEQDGTHVWSKRWGDASTQQGTAIVFDQAGDVVVAGINYGTIDFGGDPKSAEGLADLFVAKLGANDGVAAWTSTFGDQNGGTMGSPYLATADGRIFLANADTSASLKSVDFGDGLGVQEGYFFLAALDGAGQTEWSRVFAGLRGVYGLAADNGNSVVIVGGLESTTDFGDGDVSPFMNSRDLFAAKYDVGDGSYRWARIVGDWNQQTNTQSGYGVDFDQAGNVYVAGAFGGVINWGDGELLSGAGLGGTDAYVGKLAP
jgi:hypothetical protein